MSDPVAAPLVQYPFDVMGTSAVIVMRGDEASLLPELRATQEYVQLASDTLTRFDPSSELEQLNDSGEGEVSQLLWDVLTVSQAAHRDTGGLVDVSIGADIIAAGYDRDFDELDVPADAVPSDIAGAQVARGAVREPGFTLDDDGGRRLVRLRPGVRIDLGGIAKGWASDRAVARLAPYGSCLVNLGGDIAIHVAEGDDPWPIGVDHGTHSQTYELAWGGLATSGIDRRYWRNAATGELAHHVIDPRTGRSAALELLRITVIGATCVDAEIWAKALALHPLRDAIDMANSRGIASVIVDLDGNVHLTGSLAH